MKKKIRIMLMALVATTLWACGEKEEHLNVDPTMLYGHWVKTGTEYYWTFNADGTGNLVNRGEVEEGDEDNGDFTWTLTEGDQLLTEFRGGGELGGIYIPKRYTIKEISSTNLRLVDIYDRSTKLTKID